MATQIIQNAINLITLDDTKYAVNTYNESVGWLEVVNIVDPIAPFTVCRIYAGLTHWIVPPVSAKFKKSTGVDVTLD